MALVSASAAPQTKVIKATVDPRWDNAHVPDLTLRFQCLADVQTEHLFLAVWDKDFASRDDHIGTAVLSLACCNTLNSPAKFELDVVRDGQVHGRIAGRVEITDQAAGPRGQGSPAMHQSEGWYTPGPALAADTEHSVSRIRVATFNCGNAPAEAGQLEALVRGKPDGGGREAEADIFVLGLQESVVNTDGDELVKGASKAKQIMKGSVGMKSPLDAFWTDSVARALGEGWALVSLSTLAEMRLLIFARRHVIPEIAELETAQEACGIGGVVGSKCCVPPLAFGTVLAGDYAPLTVSAVCRRQGRAVGKIQGARYLSLLHIVSPSRS